MKQTEFQKINWKHRYSHGGILRQQRAGRGARPLSGRDPLHLVLKCHRGGIGHGLRSPKRFTLINELIRKYAKKFFISVEQFSIQGDHIHLLLRPNRRSNFQSFFRVLPGQIAQRFEHEGLLDFAAQDQVTDTPKTSQLAGNRFGKRKQQGPTDVSNCRIAQIENTIEADRKKKSVKSRKPKLWKYRPFTRVIRGWKAYQTTKSYVQLNEQEAKGSIPYRKQRMKGLSTADWALLWG